MNSGPEINGAREPQDQVAGDEPLSFQDDDVEQHAKALAPRKATRGSKHTKQNRHRTSRRVLSADARNSSAKSPVRKRPRPRLPLKGELVLVPSLPAIVRVLGSSVEFFIFNMNQAQSDAERTQEASDPIEEPVSIRNDSGVSVTTRAQSLRVLRDKFRGRSRNGRLDVDTFNFVQLNQALPVATERPTAHAGDGFEQHEIGAGARFKRQRPKIIKPKIGIAPYGRLALAPTPKVTFSNPQSGKPQTYNHVQAQSFSASAPQAPNVKSARSQRPADDLVRSQLKSLTAPARAYTESDDDDNSTNDEQDSGSESASAAESAVSMESDVDDNVNDATNLLRDSHGHENDAADVLSEDMLLDATNVGASTDSVAVVTHHVRGQVVRPGQLARTQSTGPWNQADEDIDDAESVELERNNCRATGTVVGELFVGI